MSHSQDLVCAMGRSAGFGYGLWAIALNQLPEREVHKGFLKDCHII
jgi:hypothetical protein